MARFKKSNIPESIEKPRIGFLLCSAALLAIGLVMSYSANSINALNLGSTSIQTLLDQGLYAILGIGLIVVLYVLPFSIPQLFRGRAIWIVVALVLALFLGVTFFGDSSGGAQRWLRIGSFSFQPAELVKPMIALIASQWISLSKERGLLNPEAILLFLIGLCLPVFLVFTTQSDLGTTCIMTVCIFAMVLFSGLISLPVLVGVCVVICIFGICAITNEGYRSDRLSAVWNPEDDGYGGRGGGAQTIRSQYAYASGGLFGVGLGNSREKFLYLPAVHTDYIFALVGEELGMIGCVVIIALFIGFTYFGFRIAREARDEYSSLLVSGLIAMTAFQAFLNIGCALSLFPMTGKPLPFISNGGTSLVASLAIVALVLRVSKDSDASADYEKRRRGLYIIQSTDAANQANVDQNESWMQSDPFASGTTGSGVFGGSYVNEPRNSSSFGSNPLNSGSSYNYRPRVIRNTSRDNQRRR